MHQSVLLQEFLRYAVPSSPAPVLWDGTMGAAGHLIAWLKKNPGGRAFGSDQDTEMMQIARKEIEQNHLENRVTIAHGNFSENPFEKFVPFDIILLDLGISSFHLDDFNRGISFRDTSELDMRLNTNHGIPLRNWLRKARFEEIRDVIYKFGEESHAAKIASKIVEQREGLDTLTADWLNEICRWVYSSSGGKYEKNPGVKTFQAFRIFINKELEHLETAMNFIPGLLKVGGQLFVISFHSLEDRIVKHTFKNLEKIKNEDPMAKSVYSEGNYRLLVKKAIIPTEEEIAQNNRSRSAKMRILQRIR